MQVLSTRRWNGLERWSPKLLLLGGTATVVFAMTFAVEAVQGTTVPTGIVAGTAFTLAFVGLVGLSPSLTDRSPWLVRLGVTCAVLGAIGFAALWLVGAARLAGLVPTPEPGWLVILNLPRIVGLIPGFLLFGIASLRSDAHPRAVGLFLVTPAVAFSINFVAVLSVGGGDLSPWVAFVITLGEAAGLLGAGYLLATASDSTESERRPAPTD